MFRLRFMPAFVSLAVCIATVVLWVRSERHCDYLYLKSKPADNGVDRACVGIAVMRGSIQLGRLPVSFLPESKLQNVWRAAGEGPVLYSGMVQDNPDWRCGHTDRFSWGTVRDDGGGARMSRQAASGMRR